MKPAPLRRGGALRRSSTPIKRRTRIKPMSDKRRAEMPQRSVVREQVISHDRGCRALGLAPDPCSQVPGRAMLEVHEVIGRGRGGDYLDPDNCIALCPGHHDWVTEHPSAATALGLLARRQPPQ